MFSYNSEKNHIGHIRTVVKNSCRKNSIDLWITPVKRLVLFTRKQNLLTHEIKLAYIRHKYTSCICGTRGWSLVLITYFSYIWMCQQYSGVIFLSVLALPGRTCIPKHCGYIKLHVTGWSLMRVEIILLRYTN